MADDLVPVTSRVSQLLVAFTVEIDNELEARLPHRTSADRGRAGAGHGPLLVSWVMWANFLRLVPAGGVALRELIGPYGVPKLAGLQRAGYLLLRPPDGASGPPRPDQWRVELTPYGRQAAAIWPGLPALVESRWRERFGPAVVDALAEALRPLGDRSLPRYPSVLGDGLFATTPTPAPGPPPVDPDLSVLLAWVVGRFTAELETTSAVSAAVGTDVLRLLDPDGVPVGDLPRRGGISREAVATAVGWLTSAGHAEESTTGRVRTLRLTSKGSLHRQAFLDQVAAVVDGWRHDDVVRLEGGVEPFVAQPHLVAEGLRPYEDGWRWQKAIRWQTEALLADPFDALPHHPLSLPGQGFPDGS